MTKPEFIDNRDGNTLGEALRQHLDWLGQTYKAPVELSVATGYFNPGGFALVAEHLDRVSRVRLLLGAEPIVPPKVPTRKIGEDPRGEAFRQKLLKTALSEEETAIRDDRNLLEFASASDRSIKRLLEFLASGKVEVRRYERGFLHGKAFIFAGDEGVLAGSSNFTAAGLTANRELNLGHYQPHLVKQVKDWFDRLWDEAVPYDLAAIYQERYAEYPPYLIYLRVLWELYKNELEHEREPSGRIPLTTFQTDGVSRAARILDEYNGVIIADGVGLGKSFIAGELMRLIQEQNWRVLLISPAALRDGTWERFQTRHQLRFENISFEQLVRGTHEYGHQDNAVVDYEMVVIDEAQAFRNPSAERAAALRALLRGKRPKKLVLMSATPVNNSLWDLYYLLTYFIKHDAVFADRGILSLKERFKFAQQIDPFDLKPDTLYDVLDPVTVRRTRRFVQRWYPNERIPGPDGTLIPVRFPTPHVAKIDYDLDAVLPEGFFDDFEDALAPQQGHPKLTMARYWPSGYLLEGEVESRELALVGLLRSGLLKRFESSVYAFARTCARLADSHDRFLQALDAGFVPSPEAMDEWSESDSDDAFEELLRSSGSLPISEYDVEALRNDVLSDRALLRRYAEIGAAIAPKQDPKLVHLVEELVEILHQAAGENGSDTEQRDRRKVLIFSYFADTVKWIYDYLLERVEVDRRLSAYRGRIAAISGDQSLQGGSREATVYGFAPHSTEAPPRHAEDLYDILVTTDVLAEGMNLQQCRHIINFDLPWNPMRLVQRHGRIDRIGSPHEDVYVRCFFPDKRLDTLLRLEHRVRGKLAQAAASIGLETEVIPGGSTAEVVFAETREQINALRRGDARLLERGGEPEGAHSGEEYRQELRKGLEEWGDQITNLPWGAGSGIKSGLATGWFFCARIGDKPILRFVPTTNGESQISDTLTCLRYISCEHDTPRVLSDFTLAGAYGAWQRARESIFAEWTKATDPKNLQPKVRPLFHAAANHLRQFPPAGLDQKTLDAAVDSLLAPWGMRYERELRTVMDDDEITGPERSEKIVEKIHELGLSPHEPPKPLPLIDAEEVRLVCWMAVGPT